MSDASTRGRANRLKGAKAERDVAIWLRPWYPDACRAIRNTYPDPGDLDCTSPGVFWSVKDCKIEQINAWMEELDHKADGRIGLLVVKRRGHASPGEWWCYLALEHLSSLLGGVDSEHLAYQGAPVRMELRYVMPLLVLGDYAPTPRKML